MSCRIRLTVPREKFKILRMGVVSMMRHFNTGNALFEQSSSQQASTTKPMAAISIQFLLVLLLKQIRSSHKLLSLFKGRVVRVDQRSATLTTKLLIQLLLKPSARIARDLERSLGRSRFVGGFTPSRRIISCLDSRKPAV